MFEFKYIRKKMNTKLNVSLKMRETIKNKIMSNFGFIKCTCSSFIDPLTLKILYCFLIRSDLQ